MTATMDSQPQRWPVLVAPLATGCCLAIGAAYVTVLDPSDGGVFLPCPFRTSTGWWCPGCGLTRATHHLLRGDVVQAHRYNALVVVVLAAIVAGWMGWLLRATGRSAIARIPVGFQLAAGGVLAAFAVVRNLPAVPFLRG